MFEIDNQELSAMYWAEEEEMKLGNHPSQVKERIESNLNTHRIEYDKITFLDWNIEGPRVIVSLDNSIYGVFNYEINQFEKEEV